MTLVQGATREATSNMAEYPIPVMATSMENTSIPLDLMRFPDGISFPGIPFPLPPGPELDLLGRVAEQDVFIDTTDNSDSLAVFGRTFYEFPADVRATLGLRFTHDRKRAKHFQPKLDMVIDLPILPDPFEVDRPPAYTKTDVRLARADTNR
jgi:hypothetical protein